MLKNFSFSTLLMKLNEQLINRHISFIKLILKAYFDGQTSSMYMFDLENNFFLSLINEIHI